MDRPRLTEGEIAKYQQMVFANIVRGEVGGIEQFSKLNKGEIPFYLPPIARKAQGNMSTRLMFTNSSERDFRAGVVEPLKKVSQDYGVVGIYPGEDDEGFHMTYQNGDCLGLLSDMRSLGFLDERLQDLLVGLPMSVDRLVPGLTTTARVTVPRAELFEGNLIAKAVYGVLGFAIRDYTDYKGVTVQRLLGKKPETDLLAFGSEVNERVGNPLRKNPIDLVIETVESMTQDRYARGVGIIY